MSTFKKVVFSVDSKIFLDLLGLKDFDGEILSAWSLSAPSQIRVVLMGKDSRLDGVPEGLGYNSPPVAVKVVARDESEECSYKVVSRSHFELDE